MAACRASLPLTDPLFLLRTLLGSGWPAGAVLVQDELLTSSVATVALPTLAWKKDPAGLRGVSHHHVITPQRASRGVATSLELHHRLCEGDLSFLLLSAVSLSLTPASPSR